MTKLWTVSICLCIILSVLVSGCKKIEYDLEALVNIYTASEYYQKEDGISLEVIDKYSLNDYANLRKYKEKFYELFNEGGTDWQNFILNCTDLFLSKNEAEPMVIRYHDFIKGTEKNIPPFNVTIYKETKSNLENQFRYYKSYYPEKFLGNGENQTPMTFKWEFYSEGKLSDTIYLNRRNYKIKKVEYKIDKQNLTYYFYNQPLITRTERLK